MSRVGRLGWVLVVLWGGSACAGVGSGREETITPELVAANNRAVGLMGQFDFSGAVAAFAAARQAHPDWPGARLNHAIALMNRQQPGDAQEAEQELRALVDVPGVGRRARYTLALLLAHEGRDAESLPLLQQVEAGTPPDGFATYFAGQQRLTEAPAEALASFRTAIAREPLLRSAYYGAFLALRRLNREADAGEMLARFQALEQHPQALVAEFKYTRMGPLAEVVLVDIPGATPSTAPGGPRFLPAATLLDGAAGRWKRDGQRLQSITVADIDADGALDLFIADALEGPSPNAVLLRRGAGFALDPAHPLASVTSVRAALWGDLDDDGRIDVVLCRPSGGTRVMRQTETRGWRDVTPSMGAAVPPGDIADGALFDADHDGDLDILLVNRSGPNELLNNDGNLRFRAIGGQAGIAGDGRPSLGFAIADLDGDRDHDLIVIKAAPPNDVFINDRAWTYHRAGDAHALGAAQLSAVLPGDTNADGQAELYSTGPQGLQQWRRANDGSWAAVPVGGAGDSAPPLAWADTDGDGVQELLTSFGEGWRSLVPGAAGVAWPVATRADGAAPVWSVAHLDPATGPSIVALNPDGSPVIWSPGPGRRPFVSLSVTGRDPTSDQRRSNISGVGTRVALRTGSRWAAFDTTRLASGPGQSAQPVSIGLGGAPHVDFVTMTWSDGVLQTELGLEAGRLHVIGEIQRQLSSCPVLFAWDGSRYTFVTDILGVGGIGFLERPGVYSDPFPRENVMLPEWLVPGPDGAYRLRVAEPMEEVAYLDRLSLVAYDLPPGWKMALDERKAVSSAPPTGEPVFYREERLPVRVTTDAGEDATERLREADLKAAGPAALVPRFIGMAEPWSLTLTFDTPIDRGRGRPVLLADGWVEYPYAQTVFAAWQAGARYDAPTLEARGEDGRWRVVAEAFGYPAGMPRQMALPLPPLPRGTTALRLRTTQEIYWDRLAIVYSEPLPEADRSVLPLRSASLDRVGFAKRTTGPQRTPLYDEAHSVPLDDTRHPRGWYTEFGRIDPLVTDEDSAVAIVGPGEAVTAAFDAPTARPAPGWTRHLVLESRGWCKDMDLYTKDGDTVGPLPGSDTHARSRLHAQFNTRYAGGR